jgi:anti-anti-sigma factor
MYEESAPASQPIVLCFLRGVTLVRLSGPLSRRNPSDVEALGRALAAEHHPVVVNVAAVTEIDIGGLRWVMRLTQEARRQGESLILESPTACVEKVLTLTGCHTWFSAATRPGPGGRTDTARLLNSLSA